MRWHYQIMHAVRWNFYLHIADRNFEALYFVFCTCYLIKSAKIRMSYAYHIDEKGPKRLSLLRNYAIQWLWDGFASERRGHLARKKNEVLRAVAYCACASRNAKLYMRWVSDRSQVMRGLREAYPRINSIPIICFLLVQCDVSIAITLPLSKSSSHAFWKISSSKMECSNWLTAYVGDLPCLCTGLISFTPYICCTPSLVCIHLKYTKVCLQSAWSLHIKRFSIVNKRRIKHTDHDSGELLAVCERKQTT